MNKEYSIEFGNKSLVFGVWSHAVLGYTISRLDWLVHSHLAPRGSWISRAGMFSFISTSYECLEPCWVNDKRCYANPFRKSQAQPSIQCRKNSLQLSRICHSSQKHTSIQDVGTVLRNGGLGSNQSTILLAQLV